MPGVKIWEGEAEVHPVVVEQQGLQHAQASPHLTARLHTSHMQSKVR